MVEQGSEVKAVKVKEMATDFQSWDVLNKR